MKSLTLSELQGWYVKNRHFLRLKPESQRSYLRNLNRLIKLHPQGQRAGALTAEEVDGLFEREERAKGTHAAVTLCRISKRVYNVAIRYPSQTGVMVNPWAKMGLPGLATRKVVWSEDFVWLFWQKSIELHKRPVGLLAMLCWAFAQRPVDMRLLKWENIKTGVLIFTTEKTGVEVRLYIPDFMQDILRRTKRISEYIVCQDDGTPFDSRLYNLWAHKVKVEAKIPNQLKIGDLRKTAFTEMGDHESTDQEMMSYGHLNREELTTYSVRSVAQSRNAANKRFGNGSR